MSLDRSIWLTWISLADAKAFKSQFEAAAAENEKLAAAEKK
jgi:hypothetical protein